MEENIIIKNDVEEISLKELILKIIWLWRFVVSNLLLIIGISFLGGVFGFFYAKSQKPIYIARTNFVLEDAENGGGLGQYAGLASMVGVDVGGAGGIFQGDNILALYKSRKMIEKTLLTKVEFNNKKILLVDYYIEFNQLREKWKKAKIKQVDFSIYESNNDNKTLKYNRLKDSILGVIVGDVNENYLSVVKVDKKLNIITAEVKAPDETFAKIFDEEIVKNVNDFYVTTKIQKSRQNIAILQNKVDSVRNRMNGAIYSAASVADATPNLNITRQVQRVAPAQQSQFSAETNRAVLGEMLKNLELSKITILKETPLIQIIDQPVFPLEKKRLGKIKAAVIGAFLTGFLTFLVLFVKKGFKMIMN